MKKAFTMIEILISISIIAILTAVGIISYVSINRNARDAKRKGDVEQIRSALELFRSDNGYYPAVGTTEWVGASDLGASLVDGYLPAIPSDPKGDTSPYMYRATHATDGIYYGYCLAALIEGTSSFSSCEASWPGTYTYGTKNP